MDQIRLLSTLVFSVVTSFASGIYAQSAPIVNNTGGTEHNTIYDALAAASPGDVLVLGALSFQERVLIEMPLTIIGDVAGGTVIDVRGKDGWGIWLGSSNITLENITVLSNIAHVGYGIHCDPGTTGLTLRNVRVLNNGSSGIDLNGLVGPGSNVIEECEVLNCSAGFGLSMSSCQNVVIKDFTASKNGYGDVGILESAYTSNSTTGLRFEGTMSLSGPQGNGQGGIVIQADSTILTSGVGAGFDIDMQAGLIHTLRGSSSYDGGPYGYVLCKSTKVSALAYSLSVTLGISDLVGTNITNGEWEVWPGMRIQSAINVAGAGSTIRVMLPGLFDTDHITVNKALNILGPNEGIAANDPARTNESIFQGGMTITSSDVFIDGIRLLGADGDQLGLGISAGAGNVIIENTVIRGWYEENGSATPVGLINEGGAQLTGCSLRNWPLAIHMFGGDLGLDGCVVADNAEALRFDAANGVQDEVRVQACTFRNAGADAFGVTAADASDSLVVLGGAANLHRHAFRMDADCGLRVQGGLYYESEEQVVGLSTEARITLCEENDFNNPPITIDACMDPSAVNYEACATVDSDNCEYAGCRDTGACNFDPTAVQDDGSCEYITCAGCINPIACNYDATATINGGGCEFLSCRGCTDPTALNYDADATFDDGSCLYPGCTDPDADNYDPDANFNNGVCFYFGCTDAGACNYDPQANINTTCDFASCTGCLNPRACNYDAAATISDGSCDFTSCRGCTDPDALNYDADATIDDGSCRIPGCLDPTATNYDAGANYNDGSCLFAGCTDAGACNYDADADSDDGSCEFSSCAGCAIAGFCNYDPTVTIHDGSLCDYLSCCGDPAANNYDPDILSFLTYGCTYGMPTGMSFVAICSVPIACNYLADAPCDFDSCAGCTDASACNYDASATLSISTCTYPAESYLDCSGNCLNDGDSDGICDELEVAGCQDSGACNYNPDATNSDGSCEFTSCAGCTDDQACNYDATATLTDGSCEYTSCAGCMDPAACNYDATATQSDDCTYPIDLHGLSSVDCAGNCLADADLDGICDPDEVAGCTNVTACNYNPDATDNDGSCDLVSCAGCTDASACNYDATATKSDNSCEYESCAGCQDPAACNYDATAVLSANCTYPAETYLDCAGECLVDTDGDGICDSLEIGGCTDVNSCNFDDAATDDDGSCEYASCSGCTNPGACNFQPTATINDGSCNYTACQGCTDPGACNYIPGATTDDGSCIYVLDLWNVTYLTCGGVCLNDADGDGICDEQELSGCTDPTACNYLAAAEIDDASCEYTSCGGCTDQDACNYNAGAQFDDGSCSYPLTLWGKEYVDCLNVCLNDFDGDGICDEEETGCTDPDACNYDAIAVTDDGSCTYSAETYLDCNGDCINDADGDGVCDELEILGCTDGTACNFSATATDDDGSCTYVTGPCDTCLNGVVIDGDANDDGVCDGACLGDFNDDGVRSASDVLVVLAAYGCSSDCGDADLDGNGFVTASDVLEMLSYFGTYCQ